MTYSKEIVREWLDQVAERAKDYPEWVDVFERCYTDTLDNTVEILEDGSTFVLTGDIPAMWLRKIFCRLFIWRSRAIRGSSTTVRMLSHTDTGQLTRLNTKT